MSTDLPKGRIALGDLVDRKGRRRILMSGAYTAPFARTLDRFVDALLVDREVARAIHGFHSTADATLDMMILHGQAVMRGSERAAVLIELPTGTYESTSDRALHDAELLVETTGCAGVAVPIEVETIEVIRVLVDNAIPVLGLVEVGERATGTGSDDPDWLRIQTTRNVQAAVGAGAFGILALGFDDALLEELTRSLRIPVLGAESAGVCDGQYLNDTEFLSMISAIKTASRTRPPQRATKPAGADASAAPIGAGTGPVRAQSVPVGTSADPTVPHRTEPHPTGPQRTEPVAMRSAPPIPSVPPVRTDPAAPRTPLPAPAARAPAVPPPRKTPDPVVAPAPATAMPIAKAPISLSRPAGPAPTVAPRPAPPAARPAPASDAAQPAARARPAIAAPGSRPPPPSTRADVADGAMAPPGPSPAPPLLGTGTVPPRAPSMPPMRSPAPIAPPPPVSTLSGTSIAPPPTEPARPAVPAARAPSPAPAVRAPTPMPPPRSPSAAETRPAAAEAVVPPDEMDVTIPVKMPPARTRRPAPAIAEEAERPPAVVPDPIPEAAIPVRAEAPEEEPTRLIVPEAPPVEEVTSSRIAWTGPPKPEKQTLFGALRGRLKSTPRVIAIGIGLAAASAGLGPLPSQTAADVERVGGDIPRVERAG